MAYQLHVRLFYLGTCQSRISGKFTGELLLLEDLFGNISGIMALTMHMLSANLPGQDVHDSYLKCGPLILGNNLWLHVVIQLKIAYKCYSKLT